MQTRILRLYSERYSLSLKETACIFETCDVLQYISSNFELFHIEGDEAILEDVVQFMKNKGLGNDKAD